MPSCRSLQTQKSHLVPPSTPTRSSFEAVFSQNCAMTSCECTMSVRRKGVCVVHNEKRGWRVGEWTEPGCWRDSQFADTVGRCTLTMSFNKVDWHVDCNVHLQFHCQWSISFAAKCFIALNFAIVFTTSQIDLSESTTRCPRWTTLTLSSLRHASPKCGLCFLLRVNLFSLVYSHTHSTEGCSEELTITCGGHLLWEFESKNVFSSRRRLYLLQTFVCRLILMLELECSPIRSRSVQIWKNVQRLWAALTTKLMKWFSQKKDVLRTRKSRLKILDSPVGKRLICLCCLQARAQQWSATGDQSCTFLEHNTNRRKKRKVCV